MAVAAARLAWAAGLRWFQVGSAQVARFLAG
jgi:hypothetical protein